MSYNIRLRVKCPLDRVCLNLLTPELFFFVCFCSYRLPTHRRRAALIRNFFDDPFLKGNRNFGQRGPNGPPGR